MKAIGYASINTLNPHPDRLNLEDQERMIREYAAQQGMELIDVYSEVKSTNNDLRHPKLAQMLGLAAEGEIDTVIIARLDRLTRNIRYLNAIVGEICGQYGVDLISIEEGLNTSADSGRMAINMIDIFTKWDTKRISDRTREIIARKRERGERVGHAPFGYTYSNKKLIAVDSELKTVALIREQRDSGYSYHKIAKYLNERKIPSKRGGIWYAETVKTVYQNALHGRHRPDEPSAPAGVGM